MALTKITEQDTSGKGNTGKPDTPELSTAEMQHVLDELALDVIIPKYNALIDELAGANAAAQIGTAAGSTVEAELAALKSSKADAAEVLSKTNTEVYTPSADYHPATKKYADDLALAAGTGDMLKSVYDADDDGVVDDSKRLDGQPASHYATAEQVTSASSLAAAAQATANAAMPKSGGTFTGEIIFADTVKASEKLSMKLLWTNASVTSSFAAQTIPIDLSGYQAVYILFLWDTRNTNIMTISNTLPVEDGLKGRCMSGYSNNVIYRGFIVRTSGIEFESCTTPNDSLCIPYKIYGIKGVS